LDSAQCSAESLLPRWWERRICGNRQQHTAQDIGFPDVFQQARQLPEIPATDPDRTRLKQIRIRLQ